MVLLGDGIAKVLGDAQIVVLIVQEADPVPNAKLGFPVEANEVQLVDIASTKDQAPSGALVDFQEESGVGNLNIVVVVEFLGPSLSSLCS